MSKLIDTAFRLREKADYKDFFVASKGQAQEQILKARDRYYTTISGKQME